MTEREDQREGVRRKAPVGGWIFLLLTAAGALLLLLGRNALTGIEGDAAECCRRLLGSYELFAEEVWLPDSLRTIAYSRLLKPFVLLFGRNEWALRLPSVILAVSVLIGTGILTRRFFGSSRAALLSGWLLLGSYGFLFWGRCAYPAMLECCAILWGAVMIYGRKRFFLYWEALLWFLLLLILWLFSGLIGMGMLISLTLPLLIGKRGVLFRKWPQFLGALLTAIPAAAVITTLTFRGWHSWLGWQGEWGWLVRLARWLWQDAWLRLLDGHYVGWWHSGAENLLRLILPWPPLCLIAAAVLWKERKNLSPALKKLMLSVLVIFCIFGIFPERRWQILLPLLPFLTVMTAGGLWLNAKFADGEKDGGYGNSRWAQVIGLVTYWICAFLGAVAIVLPVTWPVWKPLFLLTPPPLMMCLVPLLGICTLTALIFSGERDSVAEKLIGIPGRLAGTVLGCVALSAALLAVALPALTEFRTEREFLLKVRGSGYRDAKIVFIGQRPSSQALFYLASPGKITAVFDGRELRNELKDTRKFSLIGRNEERVRSIIAESGIPADIAKPAEMERTPIRLFRTESAGDKWYLWRGVNRYDNTER